MSFSPQQRSQCVEWLIEEGKSVSGFQQRYRREQRANQGDHRVTAPDAKSIKKWYAKFKEGDLKTRNKLEARKQPKSFNSSRFYRIQVSVGLQTWKECHQRRLSGRF
uniref:DUF4817 domain-containing protein n=1 Tax=Ditylenchus dipsaci TaxID=166011 RepID=A0A915E2Q6_9BILA